MAAWLALLPPLTAALLLLGLRTGLATASLAALLAGLPAVLALLPAASVPGFLLRESLAGAFLAFVPCSVMAAGLFFHALAEGRGAVADRGESGRHRRLYALCFLLSPVAESATGFGVGQLAAASGLALLGLRGAPAVALGLLSQLLVPWGALAVAPVAMAGLLGLDQAAFGRATAWILAPVLLLSLGLFWRLLERAGETVRPRDRLEDLLWTLALALLLPQVQAWPGMEVAGIAAPGALGLLHLLRDGTLARLLQAGLPAEGAAYLALCLVLLATRSVPGLASALSAAWAWRPYSDLPALAPLWLPTVPILAVAFAVLLWRGRPGAAAEAVRRVVRGWRPIAATLAFVVLARWLLTAGAAAAAGAALHDAFGAGAVVAAPLLGGVVCWLTGSNTASLAMLGPVIAALGAQAGLAAQPGLGPVWAPAALNAAGCFSVGSTLRVGMGVGLAGGTVEPRAVYALLLPWMGCAGVMLAAATGLRLWLG